MLRLHQWFSYWMVRPLGTVARILYMEFWFFFSILCHFTKNGIFLIHTFRKVLKNKMLRLHQWFSYWMVRPHGPVASSNAIYGILIFFFKFFSMIVCKYLWYFTKIFFYLLQACRGESGLTQKYAFIKKSTI